MYIYIYIYMYIYICIYIYKCLRIRSDHFGGSQTLIEPARQCQTLPDTARHCQAFRFQAPNLDDLIPARPSKYGNFTLLTYRI